MKVTPTELPGGVLDDTVDLPRLIQRIALPETAAGVLERLAGCIELRLVLHQRQHRSARDWLPFAYRINRR